MGSAAQRAVDHARAVEAHTIGAGAWMADLEQLLLRRGAPSDWPPDAQPYLELVRQARAALGRAHQEALECRVLLAEPGPLLAGDERTGALVAIRSLRGELVSEDDEPHPFDSRLRWLEEVIARG